MGSAVPNSSLTSYATPAQLIAFKDIRVIADLLQDAGARVGGTQPNPTTVEADPNLQNALNWASGQIEAACLVADKYAASDLNSLTGMSQVLLQGLCCDLAYWKLLTRRYPTAQLTEEYRAAQELLERLRLGERIFGLQENGDAGLPNTTKRQLCGPNAACLTTTIAYRYFGVRSAVRCGPNGAGGNCGCGC